MATGSTETRIARPVEAVWAVVGDFGGLHTWLPGIESCTVDGDVRNLSMMGMEIAERLVRRDDAERSIAYGIVPGTVPVTHHLATITVRSDADGSHVTWEVEVEPDEMCDFMVGTYTQGLEALKTHCEG